MTWGERLFEFALSVLMLCIICVVYVVGTPIKWAAQLHDWLAERNEKGD